MFCQLTLPSIYDDIYGAPEEHWQVCIWGTTTSRFWVVLSGAISRVSIPITHIRGLLALLIATHEPPSNLTCKP